MPEVVDGWDIVGLKKKKSRPTAGGVNEFATMEEAVEDGEHILLPALSLLIYFYGATEDKILTRCFYIRHAAVTYGITSTLHQLANEPSLGMYRLQVRVILLCCLTCKTF